MSGQLNKACEGRNYDFIAGYLSAWYKIEISRDDVQSLFERSGSNGHPTWHDGSWLMWLKNGLIERGHFHSLQGRVSDDELFLSTATLHIFFPRLLETEEMLSRLPEPESGSKERKIARSKIFATQKVPAPIDGLASKVSSMQKRE